jgi:hypothetical protein
MILRKSNCIQTISAASIILVLLSLHDIAELSGSVVTAFLEPRSSISTRENKMIINRHKATPELEPPSNQLDFAGNEAARDRLQLEVQEAEARRLQIEKEILSNTANVEKGRKNLENSLSKRDSSRGELETFRKKPSSSGIGETISSLAELSAESIAGLSVGSVGALALGRIALRQRRNKIEEEKFQKRLEEERGKRNEQIAKSDQNRNVLFAAGSGIIIGTAVTAFGSNGIASEQKVSNSASKRNTERVAKSPKTQKRLDPDLPYLEENIKIAEQQVLDNQLVVKNAAEKSKLLEKQLLEEGKNRLKIARQLEETERVIRQSEISRNKFAKESEVTARKEEADLMVYKSVINDKSSSPMERTAANKALKEAGKKAVAQRLAAEEEAKKTQDELEKKLMAEQNARTEIAQQLQQQTDQALRQASIAKDTLAKENELAEQRAAAGLTTFESVTRDKAASPAEKVAAEEAYIKVVERGNIQRIANEAETKRIQELEAKVMAEQNVRSDLEQRLDVTEYAQRVAAERSVLDAEAETLGKKSEINERKMTPEIFTTKGTAQNFLSNVPRAPSAEQIQTGGKTASVAAFEAARTTKENFLSDINVIGEKNVQSIAVAAVGTGALVVAATAAAFQKSNENKNLSESDDSISTDSIQSNGTKGPFSGLGEPPFFAPSAGSAPRSDLSARDKSYYTNSKSFQKTPPGFASTLGNALSADSSTTRNSKSIRALSSIKSDVGASSFSSKQGTTSYAPFGEQSSNPSGKRPQTGSVNEIKPFQNSGLDSKQGIDSSPTLNFDSTSTSKRLSGTPSVKGSTDAMKGTSKFGTDFISKQGTSGKSFSPFAKSSTKGSTDAVKVASKFGTGFNFSSKQGTTTSPSSSFGQWDPGSSTTGSSPTGLTRKINPKSKFGASSSSKQGTTGSPSSPFGQWDPGSSPTGSTSTSNPTSKFGTSLNSKQGTTGSSSSPFGQWDPGSSTTGSSPTGLTGTSNPTSKFGTSLNSKQGTNGSSSSPFGQWDPSSSTMDSSPTGSTSTSNPTSKFGTSLNSKQGTTGSSSSPFGQWDPGSSTTGSSPTGLTGTSNPTSKFVASLNSNQGTTDSPSSPFGQSLPINGSIGTSNPATEFGAGFNSKQNEAGVPISPFGQWNPGSTNSAVASSKGTFSSPKSGSKRAEAIFSGPNASINNAAPFGQMNAGTGASTSSTFPAATNGGSSISTPSNVSGKKRVSDTNEQERQWRNSTPQQGDWWTEEKLDYYTSRGDRQTRSFAGSSMSASSTPGSSYSPFQPRSVSVGTTSLSTSNNSNNAVNPYDTSDLEQQWRESTPQQGDWWNQEKLDFYTNLGQRVTRSFEGSTSATPASSYTPFEPSKGSSPESNSFPLSVTDNNGSRQRQGSSFWTNSETPDSSYFRQENYGNRQQEDSPFWTNTETPDSSYYRRGNSQRTASPSSFSLPTATYDSNYNGIAEQNSSDYLDASQQEAQWRESAPKQGDWWNEEKLDYYTDRGFRATRSFRGDGIRTDTNPNTFY